MKQDLGSYLISQKGKTINAKNSKTGDIDYSGKDAANVLQSAITALTYGGLIHIEDSSPITSNTNYTISSAPITIPGGKNIVIEGEGRHTKLYTGNLANLIIVGDATLTSSFVLRDISLAGPGAYPITDLLTLRNTIFCNVESCYFYGFKNGIIFDAYQNGGSSYYNQVINCDLSGQNSIAGGTGIKFTGPSASWTANSNVVIGGRIRLCDKGIHFEHGNTNVILGPDLTDNNIGMYLSGGISNNMLGLRCENNGTWDIQILPGSDHNKFIFGSCASANKISNEGYNNKFKDCYLYVTENSGILTTNGTGNQTLFRIAHGLASIPTFVELSAKTLDASVNKYWAADNTYIYINFITPPPLGVNNIIIAWKAEL